MSFSQLMTDTPPWARLTLAIVISVTITVSFVRLLHERTLRLAHLEPEGDEVEPAVTTTRAVNAAGEAAQAEATPITPPPAWELAARVLGLTGVGFVFLLAFALGHFWSNNQDLRQAVQNEATNMGRATAAADFLPTAQGGPVLAALSDYGTSVADEQWPVLAQGNREDAIVAHEAAAAHVLEALAAAYAAGASQEYPWTSLTTAIDDLFIAATERIAHSPTSEVPSVLILIFILAITNLALTAAFLPTARGPHMFLTGAMAAITAIMLFVLIEAANPYVGGGAVQVPQIMVQP